MVVRVRPFLSFFFWGRAIPLVLTFLIIGVLGMIFDYETGYLFTVPLFLALFLFLAIRMARRMHTAIIDRSQGLMTVSDSIPLFTLRTTVSYPLEQIESVASTYDGLCFMLKSGERMTFADGMDRKAKERHLRVADFLGVHYIADEKRMRDDDYRMRGRPPQ